MVKDQGAGGKLDQLVVIWVGAVGTWPGVGESVIPEWQRLGMPKKKTHLPLKRKMSESKSYQEKQAELCFWHSRGVTEAPNYSDSRWLSLPSWQPTLLVGTPHIYVPVDQLGLAKMQDLTHPVWPGPQGSAFLTFPGDATAGLWTPLNQSEHSNVWDNNYTGCLFSIPCIGLWTENKLY